MTALLFALVDAMIARRCVIMVDHGRYERAKALRRGNAEDLANARLWIGNERLRLGRWRSLWGVL